MGQILKSRHTDPSHEALTAQDPSKVPSITPEESTRSPSPDTATQPPRLLRPEGPSARNISSSIVSNLNYARGIPNNRQKRSTPISPLVSNQHADGRFSQDEEGGKSTPPSRQSSQVQSGRVPPLEKRPSWAPPSDINSATISTADGVKADPTASDAPFQQFYSTFETLMNKLSAPLAFAGLPLTTQPAATTTTTTTVTKTPKTNAPVPATQPLDASMNYSTMISRAALRAVSRNDKSSPYGNPAESFYVVPTTGGTTSYAEIMTRADREASHHRRNTSSTLR